MATKTIRKHFNAFKGKDLRSSDLIRGEDYAIDLTNAIITKDSSLTTRPGGKIRAPSANRVGTWNYSYSSTTTGATTEEILSIADNLYKRRSNTFIVDYTGGSSPVVFNLKLDTSTATFKCTIVEGSTTVLNYDLGTGLEGAPITLANLQTQINAISASYTATISGVTTVPAAFLPITLNYSLVGASDLTMTYYDWAQINSTTTNPFAASYAARGGTDYEHPSGCNFQDDFFIATGYEYLHKYDGQTVYREGLPAPATVATAAASASAGVNVPAGEHRYIYVYKQVDNRNNITESVESSQTGAYTITLGAPGDVDVTVSNIQAGTGFNTNCATVNGNQVGVTTITVNNTPHTLKIGDNAYFLDRASGVYVTRSITATTATTITISGANVNVNNADVISNNLRIEIWRTKAGGVDYFLAGEIPNNSFAATQVFYDNLADTSLGAQYLFPFKAHDLLPVKPKYVITHDNVLVCSGAFDNPNTVYHSYIEDPEAFPAATNNFDVSSTATGGVTGLGSAEEHLIIGKRAALYAAAGSLESGFRIEKIGDGPVGIACHNATADVGAGIIILSLHGWYAISKGTQVIEVGAPVNKAFYDPVFDSSREFQLKRAWAIYNPNDEQYLCFIPSESGTGTGRYANANSCVHVYDLYKQAWLTNSGQNMGAGLCVAEDVLWWNSKQDNSGVTSYLSKQHELGTADDFADHTARIDLTFSPQWEDAQDPGVQKMIPRLTVYNLNTSLFQTPYTLTVTTEINYLYGLADSIVTIPFNQGTSSGGWGLFPWGSGGWGSAAVLIPRPRKLRNQKFKALRFIFTHGALHERAVITGWEYEMVLAYKGELTT